MIVNVSTMIKHVHLVHACIEKIIHQDSFANLTDPALGLLNDLVAVEEQNFRGS